MTKKLEAFIANCSLTYKKICKRLNTSKNKSFTYNVALVLSVTILLLTTLYAGIRANIAYSTDSNAIVSAQLFDKTAKLPIVVPGLHSNLLVDPLFFMQGHLPYHYTSFTIGNVALVLITMIAWAFLLIKLFGRRYEIPILLLLSSLILTSVIFSLSLGYTAIRNIQYPVALWFVMIVSDLLRSKRKYTRRQFWLAAIGSALFSITLAGDSFFDYGVLLPLVVVIIWYWVQSQKFTRNMVKAVALLVAVFVGAELMKAILSATNILDFDFAFQNQNSIIPAHSLAPSITIALQQLLNLQGGNVFGQVVHSYNLAKLIDFGLFLAGLVGLVMILVRANRSYRQKAGIADDNTFVFAAIAVSYFVVFWIYVLSGYVITTLPNGQIISVENTRYISLMPLLGTVGIIWLLKTYYSKHKALLYAVCMVLFLGIVASYPGIKSTYNSGAQLELAPSRASINQINDIFKSNDIHEVLADYWYGPVLRFWSNNTINLGQKAGCTEPLTSSAAKEGQFTRHKGVKSAIVVDRGGLNYGFWACTDDQIMQVYGTPSQKIEMPGVTSNPVQVWIYNAE